tara:strand:- start:45 stop:407 length:363 start_codon:yes stop_codon:yes gene_type:complete
MAKNELNHNKTLSNLNTEVKYAKDSRRWSRSGRNGETYRCSAWKDARRAYNRAHRKASKLQLSRYQFASGNVPEPFWASEPECDDGYWADRLAEQVREEYWDDLRFNAYCEEYDEVMQSA